MPSSSAQNSIATFASFTPGLLKPSASAEIVAEAGGTRRRSWRPPLAAVPVSSSAVSVRRKAESDLVRSLGVGLSTHGPPAERFHCCVPTRIDSWVWLAPGVARVRTDCESWPLMVMVPLTGTSTPATATVPEIPMTPVRAASRRARNSFATSGAVGAGVGATVGTGVGAGVGVAPPPHAARPRASAPATANHKVPGRDMSRLPRVRSSPASGRRLSAHCARSGRPADDDRSATVARRRAPALPAHPRPGDPAPWPFRRSPGSPPRPTRSSA